LAHRPIQSLTKRDAIELIDSIIERGAPIHANRMLARLRALFNWRSRRTGCQSR
jgi:hypothetical protein